MPEGGMLDGELPKLESVKKRTQKLEDDLQKVGLKIKHHEDNIKFLKTQSCSIDASILDLQADLGKHRLSGETLEVTNLANNEQQMIEHILNQDNAAAGIMYQIKVRHAAQAPKLPWAKDVVGVVATLGKVSDDNLSRIFSEFLGSEAMMAIVCKTYDGVKALEKYDREGVIDKNGGLHGLGPSIGRSLSGRFLVFCLENLRPYIGEFVPEDPQRKLAILKPRLPSGEHPPGFLGFAVNMINLDHTHLSCLTPGGHGLRETLFYSLFSRMQVYATRQQMLLALPCISDGAVSLDGGMIRSSGLFSLGERNDVEVRFPISIEIPSQPTKVNGISEQIKHLKWEKERFVEDIQREEALLNHVKSLFNTKREEFRAYLNGTKSYFMQN